MSFGRDLHGSCCIKTEAMVSQSLSIPRATAWTRKLLGSNEARSQKIGTTTWREVTCAKRWRDFTSHLSTLMTPVLDTMQIMTTTTWCSATMQDAGIERSNVDRSCTTSSSMVCCLRRRQVMLSTTAAQLRAWIFVRNRYESPEN